MKLTYTNVNGYLIPNLIYKSGNQMEQLGKYGFLRRDYLKNHRNSLYQVMLLPDKEKDQMAWGESSQSAQSDCRRDYLEGIDLCLKSN